MSSRQRSCSQPSRLLLVCPTCFSSNRKNEDERQYCTSKNRSSSKKGGVLRRTPHLRRISSFKNPPTSSKNPYCLSFDLEDRRPPSSIFGTEKRRTPIFNILSSTPKIEEPPVYDVRPRKMGYRTHERRVEVCAICSKIERKFLPRWGGFFDLSAPNNEEFPIFYC